MTDTQELLQAQEAGAQIVCAVAPYEGWEMNYDPRMASDSQPWAPRAFGNGWRYGSQECCAVTVQDSPSGGRPLGRRQVAALVHLFDHGPLQVGRWGLGTPSETHRVFGSLLRRGLVSSREMPRDRYPSITLYTLTRAGRAEVGAMRYLEKAESLRNVRAVPRRP